MLHRRGIRTVLLFVTTALVVVGAAIPAEAQTGDTLTDHIEATIVVAPADDPISRSTDTIVVAPDAVWVNGHRSGTVTRVDPETNQVVAKIDVPVPGCTAGMGCWGLGGIAANRRSVWVQNLEASALVHIDPKTNEVVGSIPAPALRTMISAPLLDGTDVWAVLDRADGTIARVSGETHAVTKTIAVSATELAPLARQGHDLWVSVVDADTGDHRFHRYDIRTGKKVLDLRDPVGAYPTDYGAVVAGGDLWLTPNPWTRLVRIDGATGEQISEYDFGRGLITQHVAGGGAMWVRRTAPSAGMFERAPWVPQTLERIDLKTDKQSTITLPAAENPSGLAYGHGSLWVGDWSAGAVYRAAL
jgi:streptogramin lyase